ncbi:hypothetical protein GF324_02595 [bacterium]|nr:hypothetical protein [bacterium]
MVERFYMPGYIGTSLRSRIEEDTVYIPATEEGMIPVEVTGISISPPYQGYVVILKEKEGDQWLPIFIGATEAHTISLLLQGLKYVRPLTYDMFHQLLEASESKVEKIEVTELKENTFYALVHLQTPNDTKMIDARPSDAIALALKTGAPIFVAPDVFTEAGMRGEVAETEPVQMEDRLEELNRQMKEAVEQEAYEEAARLRDEINELQQTFKHGGVRGGESGMAPEIDIEKEFNIEVDQEDKEDEMVEFELDEDEDDEPDDDYDDDEDYEDDEDDDDDDYDEDEYEDDDDEDDEDNDEDNDDDEQKPF